MDDYHIGDIKIVAAFDIDKEKVVPGGKWAKYVARKKEEHQDWWEDTDTVAGLHEK